MKPPADEILYHLISYSLNSNPESEQRINQIINEYYAEIKDKPKLKNISEYLIPKIGEYNIITAPIYMHLSTRYLRKINHRQPKHDAVLALIYGNTFNL